MPETKRSKSEERKASDAWSKQILTRYNYHMKDLPRDKGRSLPASPGPIPNGGEPVKQGQMDRMKVK